MLEPSCGDAEFLVHAVAGLSALGAESPAVSGVEIHAGSAEEARRRVADTGGRADIRVGDFFASDPDEAEAFDVVIGNPPYIRYQEFAGDDRAAATTAMSKTDVRLSGQASSWAPFTVHAAQFVAPGGRLAFIVPAELLTVGYAAPVRKFLLDGFASVTIVVFDHRVFDEADVDVVLVLADGRHLGPSRTIDIYRARDAAALDTTLTSTTWTPADGAAKWTPALLDADALDAYAHVTAGPGFTVLDSWGRTRLGTVTGNNNYFTLTAHQVAELGLDDEDVVALSPPKSGHLRGVELTGEMMAALRLDGGRTFLFRPGDTPSDAAIAYVAAGEAQGVHLAYKCRTRRVWWQVPRHRPADLFITSMNADTARICANTAGVHHLNSVHGIYLHDNLRELGRDLLPLASLNSVTVLGAEIVGRAMGGGMLKLEPGEARSLPVPGPALVRLVAAELESARDRVLSLLNRGMLIDAVAVIDDILFVQARGASTSDLPAVRRGGVSMARRRGLRGRRESGGVDPSSLPAAF